MRKSLNSNSDFTNSLKYDRKLFSFIESYLSNKVYRILT